MPHHLIACYTAAFNAAALTALDVLPGDPLFYADTGAKTYTPPRDMQLLAAFAGGTQLLQAQVQAPSMLRLGYMSVVPIESAASGSGDIGVATFADRPVRLVNGEGIMVKAANGAAGPVAACLICGLNTVKVPPGEGFWIRYADSATTATAGAWTLLNATFDLTLPAGTYAVIGMDHFSATAIAARLVLEGVRYRPGVVAHNTPTSRTHEMFYQAGLGVWGYFTNRSLPKVQALCTGADASHTGYLYVVRVGDAGLLASLNAGNV